MQWGFESVMFWLGWFCRGVVFGLEEYDVSRLEVCGVFLFLFPPSLGFVFVGALCICVR